MTDNYQGPGRYKHYKGGEYEVLGIALWEAMASKDDNTPDISAALIAIGSHFNDGPTRAVLEKAAELLSDPQFVIYRPLTKGSMLEVREEDFWARARSDFNELVDGTEVEVGGPEKEPRFQRMRPITVLFFGTQGGRAGHGFYTGDEVRMRAHYDDIVAKLPPPYNEGVDGKLVPTRSTRQGAAQLLYAGGWTSLSFHNYIDDSRPGSNGNFFFDTTLSFDQCIEIATRYFPRTMARVVLAGGINLQMPPATWVPKA